MPHHRMTESEVLDFLRSTPPRPAVCATTRRDGRPHATPVWYDVDDDGSIVFTTGADTVKGKTLARTGWATLCVDDDQPPFSFVIVEGPVTLSDDVDQVRALAGRLGARYMGTGRAEEYAARNGVPGELLVRLQPTKVLSARDLAE
jgi:PPOX class probable F420-dependent enzyme